MRAIITGQVGINKKHYTEAVAKLAEAKGQSMGVFHVGNRMYAEAPDVRPGRILDLPLGRLHGLRRSVFKDIINEAPQHDHVIVNTHATFRWRHGLFRAFDFDQIKSIQPDLMICLMDNIEAVAHRLHEEHILDATLKDLMVWREEEILATELAAQALGCGHRFFVLSRGRHEPTLETCRRLITDPSRPKVYPSFPMSHVGDLPDTLKEIDAFRAALAEHFIAFDPGDVDEKLLLEAAIDAMKNGQDFVPSSMIEPDGTRVDFQVSVKQIMDIAGDIDGQIYARDFLLIDQSDMIVSFVPELPGGMPGLSSGVERELQHAYETGKEVYVVWKPAKSPSPFITETATKVFTSTDDALAYFRSAGMMDAAG